MQGRRQGFQKGSDLKISRPGVRTYKRAAVPCDGLQSARRIEESNASKDREKERVRHDKMPKCRTVNMTKIQKYENAQIDILAFDKHLR